MIQTNNNNNIDFPFEILYDYFKQLGILKELKAELLTLGETIGVSIHVQHEDIFNAMHKI